MKKSNLYTRTGDKGTTSLVGGQRIAKDSARLEAYGSLDELNSWIGVAEATGVDLGEACDPALSGLYDSIQSTLFAIGSYLATDPDGPYASMTSDPVSAAEIALIESAIDIIDMQTPPIRSFVLPGGSAGSAFAHVARTVCRRAERRIVTLAESTPVDSSVLTYINRLSDLLFAIARFDNNARGATEKFWSGRSK